MVKTRRGRGGEERKGRGGEGREGGCAGRGVCVGQCVGPEETQES